MHLFDLIHRLLGRDVAREGRAIRHGMDRRRFLLTALVGTVAATTLDLEQVLWTPTPQIVVPGRVALADQFSVAMDWGKAEASVLTESYEEDGHAFTRHTFLTPQWITAEALRMLEGEMKFSKLVNQPYVMQGARIGTVLKVRKPMPFIVTAEDADLPAPLTMETEEVTLNHQFGVQLPSPDTRMPMTPEAYRRCVLRPAVASLAHRLTEAKINVLGELPDTVYGTEYAGVCRGERAAIRGIHAYNPVDDTMNFRLDVIGGHSDVIEQEERG